MKFLILISCLVVASHQADIFEIVDAYKQLLGFPGKCEDLFPVAICDRIRAIKDKLGDEPLNFEFEDELDFHPLNDVMIEDVPQTCEDVFSQATCDGLRAIAQKFGETAEDINAAIKAAATKHITNAKEILKFVQHYLVDHAVNFKCTSVLSDEQCQHLAHIGSLLKIRAEDVNEAIREAIAHGATTAADIYGHAVEYVRDLYSKTSCEDFLDADTCSKLTAIAKAAHLNTKEVIKAVREAVIEGASSLPEIYKKAVEFLSKEITCEGVFGDDVCAKLDKAAELLGEKASDVTEAIRQAISKNILKATDLLDFVQQYLVDKAVNFKCENVMDADLCAKITEIGGHFKESVDDVNKAIKEAIVKGADGVQEIYNVAVVWLRNAVRAKSCEDLIDADTCQKIRDFATKVHVSTKDVMQAVKEAIAMGAWGAADIYAKAVEYLKSKISCESVMGKSTCDKIRALADKFSVSLTKVDEVLREAIASGVTKVNDLYKVVVKYIMDRWTDLIGDEEMMDGQWNDINMKNVLIELLKEVLKGDEENEDMLDSMLDELMDVKRF